MRGHFTRVIATGIYIRSTAVIRASMRRRVQLLRVSYAENANCRCQYYLRSTCTDRGTRVRCCRFDAGRAKASANASRGRGGLGDRCVAGIRSGDLYSKHPVAIC